MVRDKAVRKKKIKHKRKESLCNRKSALSQQQVDSTPLKEYWGSKLLKQLGKTLYKLLFPQIWVNTPFRVNLKTATCRERGQHPVVIMRLINIYSQLSHWLKRSRGQFILTPVLLTSLCARRVSRERRRVLHGAWSSYWGKKKILHTISFFKAVRPALLADNFT